MDMTKGKEKGRSNAPPRNRHINNYVSNRTSLGHYCPTTFNCGVIFGFNVIRLTLSRLLSSAMFA